MLKFLLNFNGIPKFKLLSNSSTSQTFLRYSTTTNSNPSPFSNYLIKSLGFSEQDSQSTFNKLPQYYKSKVVSEDLKFVSNANSVVNLFNQIGIDNAHIRKIVSAYPRLLYTEVDKTLIPKIKGLEDVGFSKSDISELISANPIILLIGFKSFTLPRILILREILGCHNNVILFLKNPQCVIFKPVSENMVKNLGFLGSYGIPLEVIRKHLIQKQITFSKKPEIFEEIVIRVEEKFRICRDSSIFMTAVTLLCSLSEETFESKCNVFKRFGWTQTDILMLFRKQPRCFGLSEARIERALCFLMKELNYDRVYVASAPNLITSSLEKRTLPRHRVLTVLKEKGLVRKDYSLNSAVRLSESDFLKRFVLPFEDAPEVYSKLIESLVVV